MESAAVKALLEKIQLYEGVLNNILSGVLITDPDGYVIFFSDTYGKFLGMDPKAQIGKHTTDVIENSRMHIVARTGVPEINHPHQIMGRNQIVQRIPIYINGKLAAVFGQVMFEDIKDVQILADKLNILESKVQLYEKELENLRASKYSCRNIVGSSQVMTELRRLAQRAAKVNSPVLLVGDSGTGKELFAHAIHRASDRHRKPFIRLNCSAIPKDLLEAELFGYEPGAFTGAGTKGKPGKFELAHQGTIFLDEVSELPLEIQPKLLRVVEEKIVERLGATRPVKCDFRLIAATNENLEDCIRRGKFRKDLYYRLNVIPLHIPPLRERREDIPLIASHLLQSLCRDFGLAAKGISPEVMKIFQNHDWPGNVRELSNILERTLTLLDERDEMIHVEHLPLFFRSLSTRSERSQPRILKDLRATSERDAVLHAIRAANNNKNEAARILGIHRTALYKKMKKLNLPLSEQST
ncbi:MAG TPA: sigma 54-interacting transcriptional regulator [Syntrophales bacterium]|nr:sigma 54-interacting transcriptional regulator [Syntrophales bacterium]HNZ34021.1 sigma 54-interacting transcriptional regulator [Syntrophales bacterium]HOF72473.1 sigma 54-interacting transcriptional regulator [Syntrophales bacterium]HOH44172.1 sigma 54-interacting transcriptional regulator [Syntrophales bacterium]HOR32895.1 sigma 54-interacting transcriptional regulator [Syntrophales bacterium]